jgi:hypothetical protein
MPRDVREYIIRRYLKAAIATQQTKEEKGALVAEIANGAMFLADEEISPELRDELIKTAFELTDERREPLPMPPEPHKTTDS